jgi:hypothetical protein
MSPNGGGWLNIGSSSDLRISVAEMICIDLVIVLLHDTKDILFDGFSGGEPAVRPDPIMFKLQSRS